MKIPQSKIQKSAAGALWNINGRRRIVKDVAKKTANANGVTIDKPVGDAAGIFLAPLRDIILDKATLEGAIIGGGGGNGLTVHSGANLIGVIPEPPTYLAGLLAIAVLLLSHAKLLFARKETSRTDATSNCCGQKGKNSRRS